MNTHPVSLWAVGEEDQSERVRLALSSELSSWFILTAPSTEQSALGLRSVQIALAHWPLPTWFDLPGWKSTCPNDIFATIHCYRFTSVYHSFCPQWGVGGVRAKGEGHAWQSGVCKAKGGACMAGGACVVVGGACAGVMHGGGHAWWKGAYMVKVACMEGRGHVWQGTYIAGACVAVGACMVGCVYWRGHALQGRCVCRGACVAEKGRHAWPERRPLQRTVRILLEYILVLFSF